ncbi:hypothetical protein ABTM63_20035, partial [Acinetobacter baumannii]
ANLAALVLFKVAGLPVGLAAAAAIGIGAAFGAINGILVGYVKTRPFLTTLVSLIILRAAYNMLGQHFAFPRALSAETSDGWSFF